MNQRNQGNDQHSIIQSSDERHNDDILDNTTTTTTTTTVVNHTDVDMSYTDDRVDDYESTTKLSSLWEAMDFSKSSAYLLHLVEVDPMLVQQIDSTRGCYPLHIALRWYTNDDIFIMKLIEIFPEAVPYISSYGMYPLHIACRYGSSETVILKLIEIYPEAVGIPCVKDGGYPLHDACRNVRSSAVLKKLIEVYPEAMQHESREWNYPIHLAVIHDQSIDVMEIMIQINPMVLLQKDDEGRLALHVACIKHNVVLVQYLIQRSDVDVNIRDFSFCTPLDYCMEYGLHVVAEMLLQHPDIDIINALHIACKNDNIYMVHTLLQRSDIHHHIDMRDSTGLTPLHYACRYGRDPRMVEVLLQHRDIDVNNTTTNQQQSALHLILLWEGTILWDRFLPIVRTLLQHPLIRIDQKDRQNKTPLDLLNDKIGCFEDLIIAHDNDCARWAKLALPSYIEIKRLLLEFPIEQRWKAYHYLLRTFED